MTKIQEILFRHQDVKYGDFTAKLIPNISRDEIIGVRSPEFKKIIKEVYEEAENKIELFLEKIPHKYQEENILHLQLIGEIKDFDEYIFQLERFLPCIKNWAVSDGINPKVLNKNHKRLIPYVKKWIKDDYAYTKRVAMLFLMKYFLDEDFKVEYLKWAAVIRSDEYYVNMMTAWYFAEALVKQWEEAVKFLEENKLDMWTHNKAIQKARESFRITDKQKEYMKSLKRKLIHGVIVNPSWIGKYKPSGR